MANPTENWCHTTTDLKMFQDSANDLTIGSAVEGTSGTLYSNFDDLRTNCYTDYINSSYGTKGATPTQTHHFRGYPKPTVTATYSEVSLGNGDERLDVNYTIPNMIGYDIVCTSENIIGTESSSVTIYAGSTSASDTDMFRADSGDPSVSYEMVMYTDIPSYTPSHVNYAGTLNWTDPDPIINSDWKSADLYASNDCSASVSALDGTYYLGRLWYSGSFIVNTYLYKGERDSNGGSTNVGTNYFRVDSGTGGYNKVTTNSAGRITDITYCGLGEA